MRFKNKDFKIQIEPSYPKGKPEELQGLEFSGQLDA